jgi:hypothetical protein
VDCNIVRIGEKNCEEIENGTEIEEANRERERFLERERERGVFRERKFRKGKDKDGTVSVSKRKHVRKSLSQFLFLFSLYFLVYRRNNKYQ